MATDNEKTEELSDRLSSLEETIANVAQFWQAQAGPQLNPGQPPGAPRIDGRTCKRVTIHASNASEIWVRLTDGEADLERPGEVVIGPLETNRSIKASGDVVVHITGGAGKVYYWPA